MIDLSGLEPFASGANRLCFRHPDKPDHCLKVLRPDSIDRRYQKQPRWKRLLGKTRLDDNRQEQQAYRQTALHALLSGADPDRAWQHLPRLYGVTPTSLGPANDSELVLDASGQPAATLEHWLISRGHDSDIAAAIERFCDWLGSTGILTRNLLPHNLVVTDRTGQWQLVLVDGLGAPAVPDRLAALPAWRRRYINRRIQRFHKRVQWELDGRRTAWEQEQSL